MGGAGKLPFKVGDLAESKTFEEGFRGAWFRCKIKEIKLKKGVPSYLLEFPDFPDEPFEWTNVYQSPDDKGKHKHKELMVRPSYPPIYNEEQMPDANANSEVAVIVDNSWKVGDLVDWLTSGCYWTGTITKIWNDNKGEMVLIPPPAGEGGKPYPDVLFKDIRPSLDWSPEFGWTLPARGNGRACSCARLIRLSDKVPGTLPTMDTHNACDKTEADPGASSVGLSVTSPVSSNSTAVSDDAKRMHTTDILRPVLGLLVTKESKDAQGGQKVNCRNTDSGCVVVEMAEESHVSVSPSKKCKVSTGYSLRSDHSDTLEAAVLDLEESLNRVKRLQKILKHGISSSNAPSSQWKFLEPGASE